MKAQNILALLVGSASISLTSAQTIQPATSILPSINNTETKHDGVSGGHGGGEDSSTAGKRETPREGTAGGKSWSTSLRDTSATFPLIVAGTFAMLL